MNKVLSFIVSGEQKKVIATLVVAVVFLYFWINGPLLKVLEAVSLESIETKYSIPVMIGEDGIDNKKRSKSFNTIRFEEEESFGYGLLSVKKTQDNNWGFIADEKHNPALSKELEIKVFDHAKEFSKQEEKVEIHSSMDMYYSTISGKENSIYLESTDVIKNIRGYAGEVNIGVFIGEDGYLKRVEHISSKETQSYLLDIKNAGFYEQFHGVSIIKGEQEIDAVSGATLTSEAIAKTVSQLIAEGTPYPVSNYSEIDEVIFFSLSASLNYVWIVHIIVIFLMFVFAMQHWIKKSKKTILALTLLSVVYIGFFLNNSFTYISFIHPFVGTSVSSLVGLYSLFILLGAIWGKNIYCKYVCPFGNIQRLLIRVNPLESTRRFFISNKWIKRIRASIAIVLLTGVLLGLRSWSNFELFPDLFGLSVFGVWFLVSLITVLVTMVYPMIWCRLLCPTGALLEGLSDLINYKRK